MSQEPACRRPPGVMLYEEELEKLYLAKPEIRHQAFDAILNYFLLGEINDSLPPGVRMIVDSAIEKIDNDADKYNRKCDTLKKNKNK